MQDQTIGLGAVLAENRDRLIAHLAYLEEHPEPIAAQQRTLDDPSYDAASLQGFIDCEVRGDPYTTLRRQGPIRGVARTGSRPRERGQRSGLKGASRRASARSGDSGDDDDPSEPGPSRRCEGCGTDISHLRSDAKTCDQPKCKKRAQRKRANPLRYPGADADPYLTLPALELDALQGRSLSGCRCNGHHVLDGESGDCIKCGRPYRDDVAPYYVALWTRRDHIPSYVRAVAYRQDAVTA